ncbi:MAG: ROK family protein [Hyphomicrobiaceae bacterium]
MPSQLSTHRIGIDLGGSKIEGVVLDATGAAIASQRVATPRSADAAAAYEATLTALDGLVRDLRSNAGIASHAASIGIGMPGSISPATGRVQNANSTWLNGRPFQPDIEARLKQPVRLANDANCFAISEATDGAAAGAASVLGVILGTGCGAGLIINGRIVDGPRGIGGEWGHNPLPWASTDEHPGPECWCGRRGCMEAWVSGPALAADYSRATGLTASPETIVARADAEPSAQAALDRHLSRLARGLAHVVNIIDPYIIVLGGGLSALEHLYAALPQQMAPHIFADAATVDIRRPRWGDASGVRGAARLWPR